MECDGALLWTASGIDGSTAGAAAVARAGRAVDRAVELLRAAGPQEWRGAAAQEFHARMSAHVSDCLRLRAEVAEAAHTGRLLRAELAAARAELAAAPGFWPWMWRESAA